MNARVKTWAESKSLPYIDYFTAMVSADGTEMNPAYAIDRPGIHPNAEGYQVIEQLLMKTLTTLQGQ